MSPLRGEDNIPSSPGHLLLIDEGSSVEPNVHGLGDMGPSDSIEPVLRACGCKICARPSALLASQTPAQEIVSGDRVEPTPR